MDDPLYETVLEPAKGPGFISVFGSLGVFCFYSTAVPGASEDTAPIKAERKAAVVTGQLWSGFSTSTHECARHARQVCDPEYRLQHLPVPLAW